MKLKDGRATMLFRSDGMTLELVDNDARAIFARVYFTSEQATTLLSRLAYTPCRMEVQELEKVGKKMEHKQLEFKMPAHDWKNKTAVALTESKRVLPEGWQSDGYFASQDSFFEKNREDWARVTIRRWV